MPFEQVPDLVASRRVFLRRGLAYVAKDQIASLVVAHFRARLAKVPHACRQPLMIRSESRCVSESALSTVDRIDCLKQFVDSTLAAAALDSL